jgi:hypothetical protein
MPNLVPYDKFWPRNMEKAWEYLDHIARISPERLKYGDEKSLKGKAIFNKISILPEEWGVQFAWT